MGRCRGIALLFVALWVVSEAAMPIRIGQTMKLKKKEMLTGGRGGDDDTTTASTEPPTTSTTTTPPPPRCEAEGYTDVGGSFYKDMSDGAQRTFDYCKSACDGEVVDAHVATFSDLTENDAFRDHFSVRWAWIGLVQTSQNTYTWENNEGDLNFLGTVAPDKMSADLDGFENFFFSYSALPATAAMDLNTYDDKNCFYMLNDGRWQEVSCTGTAFCYCECEQ